MRPNSSIRRTDKKAKTILSRKLVVGVALGAIAASAIAGPQRASYQGNVTGAGGSPVPEGSYDMRFTFFDAATGGTNLWTETDSVVAVTDGLFSSLLGDTTAFGNLFSANPDLWLEVAIDVGGNAAFEPDEVFAPRQRLAAAWAIEADFLEGHPASFFQQRVTGTAPAGRYIRAINADGTGVTGVDADSGGDITGVTAGTGLTGGGTGGDVALSVEFGGSGAAAMAARSDHDHDGSYAASSHDHDGRYYTETELNTAGGIIAAFGLRRSPRDHNRDGLQPLRPRVTRVP